MRNRGRAVAIVSRLFRMLPWAVHTVVTAAVIFFALGMVGAIIEL